MHTVFPRIKYVFATITIVLLFWFFCQLFLRSFGGPFPFRTRGPFAKHEYYILSELEPWENFLVIPGEDKTLSERLIDADPIPPLNFTKPDALPPKENTIKKPTGLSRSTE